MLKFLQFLQEKSSLLSSPDFGGVSAGGDMDDNEVKPPIKTLGKETKKIGTNLSKLVTTTFHYWDKSKKIGDLKRSIVVAIAMSETRSKETDVLQVLEPISRDGIFPEGVFVPPQIQEWFQQLLNTRKQLLNHVSDDDLNDVYQPNVYNLIWSITNGKGGVAWSPPTPPVPKQSGKTKKERINTKPDLKG
jgi:hypothetical protein